MGAKRKFLTFAAIMATAAAMAADGAARDSVRVEPAGNGATAPARPPRAFGRRPDRLPEGARDSATGFRARPFGRLADGRETRVWRLAGFGGLTIDVSDYGGRLVRVYAPDRHGNLADVTLGWNTAAEYERNGFCVGTLIGRFGNRIADGKFTLDGTEYQLPLNETNAPRHCSLHSGPKGWDSKIWSARPFRRGPVCGIELSCVSEDGEMGFPGRVEARVTYRVLANNVLAVEYAATTDKPTVINLTQHGYWNLAGEASGDVLGQELQIFADEYTTITPGLIPVANVPVKGTPFDFTAPRPIGAAREAMAADAAYAPVNHWYDHNFVLRGGTNGFHRAVAMRDPESGRRMEIWTTEPGLQMYGAQDFDGTLAAKRAGAKLPKFAGIALETQHFPDSPNRPDFPSTVLRPGETYRSRTEFRFSAE